MNPLLAKEIRLSLRKTRAGALLLLFLGAALLIVWMLWPQEGIYSLNAQSSHKLFTVFGLGQLVLVALFAPAFTSTALTSEREQDTLASLYSTRLTSVEITAGKIIGSLAFLLLVVLSGAPALSVCLVLGGVGAGDVFWLYLITVLMALHFGMIGLTASALCRKSHAAIMATYVVIAVLSIVVVVPSLMLPQAANPLLRQMTHFLRSASPLVALASVIEPGMLAGGAASDGLPPAHLIFSCWALALSGVLAGYLWTKLRECPSERSRSAAVVNAGFLNQFRRFPFYLIDPRRRRRMIGPLSNPVLIKELRTMVFGRLQYLVRAAYGCVACSLGLALGAALSYGFATTGSIARLTVGLQMALFLFMGPTLSASLISSEIEGHRFDLLRLTRLSAWRLVSGKFQAALLPMVILMAATLPPLLMLAYVDPSPQMKTAIVHSGITLLAMLVFVTSAGLFFSAVTRRAAASIAATYGVVVLTCVVGLIGLLGGGGFSRGARQAMFVINPIVTLLSEVAKPGELEGFDLWRPNLTFLLGVSAALLLLTVLRVRTLLRPE